MEHKRKRRVGLQGVGRQLAPNVGTLLLMGLLLWAQQAGAFAFTGPGRPQGAAPAGVLPGTISYQGRLTDAAGSPVTGNVRLVFALYDVASGGAALWSEAHSSVPLQGGEFVVNLGSITPIPSTGPTHNLYAGDRHPLSNCNTSVGLLAI